MTERGTSRKAVGEPDGLQSENRDEGDESDHAKSGQEIEFTSVDELRPDGDQGTCLRPLGLCDLGGCCDTCWYSPDNPRFKRD